MALSRNGKRGWECKLYVSSDWDGTQGTIATATWTEVDLAKDVTFADSRDELDDSVRATGGQKTYDTGMRDNGIDFDMRYQPGNAGFDALKAAKVADDPIGVLMLDDAVSEPTANGEAGVMVIPKFDWNQQLGEKSNVAVSLRPHEVLLAQPAA